MSKLLTDKNWNVPSYINYLNEEIEKLKERIEEQKIYAKDIRKAVRKLEKPIKGDVINIDTVRKGIKFLHNTMERNLKKDFGVKKTI